MSSRWRRWQFGVGIKTILFVGCAQVAFAQAEAETSSHALYPGVPISGIYDVAVTEDNSSRDLTVFQSSCPKYQAGYQNMKPVDHYPLERFVGRSISWTSFSFSKVVTVHVHVLDSGKVSLGSKVKIFP